MENQTFCQHKGHNYWIKKFKILSFTQKYNINLKKIETMIWLIDASDVKISIKNRFCISILHSFNICTHHFVPSSMTICFLRIQSRKTIFCITTTSFFVRRFEHMAWLERTYQCTMHYYSDRNSERTGSVQLSKQRYLDLAVNVARVCKRRTADRYFMRYRIYRKCASLCHNKRRAASVPQHCQW